MATAASAEDGKTKHRYYWHRSEGIGYSTLGIAWLFMRTDECGIHEANDGRSIFSVDFSRRLVEALMYLFINSGTCSTSVAAIV